MTSKLSKGKKLFLLGAILVLIDQIIKISVKVNMPLGDSFSVLGDWFKILFVENEGMAFGMKFGGMVGKFILTTFRLILFGLLCWWISRLASSCNDDTASSDASIDDSRNDAISVSSKTTVPVGVLIGLTLITAGALGNIIDCLFYGVIFSESTPMTIAEFGGSYAPMMFGKVVDMFYFPLIDTYWPDWIPFIGGNHLRFFQPVFNFADSCVTVGAFYLILFQYKFFAAEEKSSNSDETSKNKSEE